MAFDLRDLGFVFSCPVSLTFHRPWKNTRKTSDTRSTTFINPYIENLPTKMTSRGVEEPQHEVYALPRGKEETQRYASSISVNANIPEKDKPTGCVSHRLDQQHRVFTRLADGLIHPSIPKQQIRKIADVATGTG